MVPRPPADNTAFALGQVDRKPKSAIDQRIAHGSPALQEVVFFHKPSRTLILTGMEAHICVAQTALRAPLDYRIAVIADAAASRSPHDRDVALERLRESGVAIASTEMLMYEWLERAGTDTFRAALPLLK